MHELLQSHVLLKQFKFCLKDGIVRGARSGTVHEMNFRKSLNSEQPVVVLYNTFKKSANNETINYNSFLCVMAMKVRSVIVQL